VWDLHNLDKRNERFFSIELRSKTDLKNATLANGENDRVLVEGTIGELRRAEFVDGVVLEVIGSRGAVRINLTENEITKVAAETSKER
jgi:hypothetical protein